MEEGSSGGGVVVVVVVVVVWGGFDTGVLNKERLSRHTKGQVSCGLKVAAVLGTQRWKQTIAEASSSEDLEKLHRCYVYTRSLLFQFDVLFGLKTLVLLDGQKMKERKYHGSYQSRLDLAVSFKKALIT
ncbi:unnamed protein product [Pleuronectes platessa]|uniref:Uncharacterized protein n=1 Tax=Pleuronectes platessa TaxID=8262 RepID=A0A9N7U4F0_PLEPL|nr:unnamed protein product [Pleuronectes platessa]